MWSKFLADVHEQEKVVWGLGGLKTVMEGVLEGWEFEIVMTVGVGGDFLFLFYLFGRGRESW